jgi:hypothetical protein
MRLVIREYLASLRERDELDAILPDMLTELGFQVYSRPARGTRQYGVDIAAVGHDDNGIKKVYLFSVKSGDLTRSEWNTASPQSLRPSLEEIRDYYIQTRIPAEFATLPIVICLCFGGDIDEQLRGEVTQYIKRNQTNDITYEQWNGDKLADVILSGILRDELLPAPLRSHLRKAAAMVEEPDISEEHFKVLVQEIVKSAGSKPGERLARARLINICLWILYGWAREADNVEAPYRASEFAILQAWHLLSDLVAKSSKQSADAGLVLNSLIELHFRIWDEFYKAKLQPHLTSLHAISSAVHSHAPLDINLKLFRMLGRAAQRGLWEVWKCTGTHNLPMILEGGEYAELDTIIGEVASLISSNPVLLTPIADEQVIDISLALTLLGCRPPFRHAINQWLAALSGSFIFNYRSHGRYPTTDGSYWDLAEHPANQTDAYRSGATEASVLLPTLALWANALGNEDVNDRIAAFKATDLQHCNFQVWLPGEDTEERLYTGNTAHGAALSHVPVTSESRATLVYIEAECELDQHFKRLSAICLGHWPIVVMACRHYRLPVPPHLWKELFQGLLIEGRAPTE